MASINIPTFKLNNGAEIPVLGYGTWLGTDENLKLRTKDLPKMEEALSYAIDIGYRHIDTAHFYKVEMEVGQIINQKIKDGVVKREDLFVTTKVWQQNHREADVELSLRASLKRLHLDYVDMVLIHWPMSISQEDAVDEKIDYLETWRGFETCLSKGLTKGIGVSNFNVEQLTRLLQNCKVPPATLQIEVNLNLGQDELVSLCEAHSIVVVAYSPFGTMVPSQEQPGSPEPKLDNPTMLGIAGRYQKTVSQVALKYLIQRGIVAIPKTITKTRVLENASLFDFTISPEDIATLKGFDCGFRTVQPIILQDFTNYPFEKVEVKEKQGFPLPMRKWFEDL